MTFKEYLAARRSTDTPQGDFTGDALSDKKMPELKTWAELKSYLRGQLVDSNVIEAARLVWQAYVSKQRKANQNA